MSMKGTSSGAKSPAGTARTPKQQPTTTTDPPAPQVPTKDATANHHTKEENEDEHASSSQFHEPFFQSRRFDTETFRNNTQNLPTSLLNEVEELLEKERVLMELKLLEQTVESQHWRQKYEELREKALDDVLEEKVEEIALDKLEELAELEIKDPPPATIKDANNILSTCIDGHVANLSNIELTKTVFIYLSRALFGMKSIYDNVRILHLQNCNLGIDHLEPLLHVVRNPKCEAIDMSKNHITEEMLLKILEVLRSRRMTPQYVLLNSNIHIALHSKVFKDILNVLSYDTWGIGLSLQDVLNNPREMYDQFLQAHRKKFKKDPTLGVRQVVKNPMRILHFLGILIDKVEEARKKEDILVGIYKGDKDKAKRAQSNKHSTGKHGKLDPRQIDVFQGLSVLALTENHMSKQSIDALEKCISIMPTLTDLDLSYSYMGYYGAVAFERILADGNCSLVRLELRGNVFTDKGLEKIQRGMQQNHSLIYLGVGNNACSAASCVSFAKSLIKNQILHVVDLRNNDDVSFEDMESIQTSLEHIGSLLLFKWDQESHRDHIQQAMLSANHNLWYFQPFTTAKYSHLDSSCRLFQADITKIYHKQPHLSKEMLVLHWMLRPITVGRNLALLQQQFLHSVGRDHKPGKITDEPYFFLNSLVFLFWEVRVVSNKNIVYKYQEPIDQDFPVRDFYSPDQVMPWACCHVLLRDIPKKGHIEIRLIVQTRLPGEQSFDAGALMGVEVKNVWGTVLPNQEEYYAGGDGPSNEVDSDRLQYSLQYGFQLELKYPELKYHSILRGLVWSTQHCSKIKLRWKMKLYVVYDVKRGDEDDLYVYNDFTGLGSGGATQRDDDKPAQYNLLQYEWAVSVHPWYGSRRVVGNQRCDGKEGTSKTLYDPFHPEEYYESRTQEELEMDAKIQKSKLLGDKNPGNVDRTENDDVDPLLAWTWQTFEVEMDNVLEGDQILLTAKLLSPSPRAAAKLAANCRIKAEDFEVYHVIGDVNNYQTEQLQQMVPICFDPLAIYDSPVRTYEPGDTMFRGDYPPDHLFNLKGEDYDSHIWEM